jgi:hypothetical protein
MKQAFLNNYFQRWLAFAVACVRQLATLALAPRGHGHATQRMACSLFVCLSRPNDSAARLGAYSEDDRRRGVGEWRECLRGGRSRVMPSLELKSGTPACFLSSPIIISVSLPPIRTTTQLPTDKRATTFHPWYGCEWLARIGPVHARTQSGAWSRSGWCMLGCSVLSGACSRSEWCMLGSSVLSGACSRSEWCMFALRWSMLALRVAHARAQIVHARAQSDACQGLHRARGCARATPPPLHLFGDGFLGPLLPSQRATNRAWSGLVVAIYAGLSWKHGESTFLWAGTHRRRTRT